MRTELQTPSYCGLHLTNDKGLRHRSLVRNPQSDKSLFLGVQEPTTDMVIPLLVPSTVYPSSRARGETDTEESLYARMLLNLDTIA